LSNFMLDGEFLRTSCGSPNYAAPEVISGKLYAGQEVDVWSCGVILFAFLCARLPFDDEAVPKLFQKIREGVFTIPDHLSPDAKDLIKQMLVVDPLKRITISEIRNHPWFQKNLPEYLQKPSAIASNCHLKVLDEEVVSELTRRMGVTRDKALQDINSVEEGIVNDTIVAYNLLYDSMKTFDNSQFDRTVPIEIALSSSPAVNLRDQQPFIGAGGVFSSPEMGTSYIDRETMVISDSKQTTLLMNHNAHKWLLGLFSSLHPKQIFADIMRILRKIHFEWKVIGPFQLRCRSIDDSNLSKMRLTIQVFKLSDNAYLIDFKLTTGTVFHFFDIVGKFMNEFPNTTVPTSL